MRSIQTFVILSTLLCFLIEAATIPADQRQVVNNKGVEERHLEPRKQRPRRPGFRKGRKQRGIEKYFQEPGGSELGNHYDSRFHHGIQDYPDKKDTQLHMLRAYLTFFNQNSLETWLAHGTLLGWWWNGKMLPWDWDIDTQVSGSTLAYMAKHYNNTHYDYVSKDDPPVKRTYLLDINPAIGERERGNGLNIIDARWIDTRNGLYIDITGLSETHPDDQPGVWACKNYHRYQTIDLYPMRETMYEGVPAKVPYAYDRILTQEYEEKALVLTEFEGHRWDPIVKEWLQKSDEELAEEKREKELERKAKEARRKKEEEARKAKEIREKEQKEQEQKEKDQKEKDQKEQEQKEKEQKEKEVEEKKAEAKRLEEEQQRMKASNQIKQDEQTAEDGQSVGKEQKAENEEPVEGKKDPQTEEKKQEPADSSTEESKLGNSEIRTNPDGAKDEHASAE